MKLRNKKTGEIVEPYLEWCSNTDKPHSLAELNKEWEDAPEEPKERYFNYTPALLDERIVALIIDKKSNRKEAKKALEKLEAWKRLKDKGFRFDGWGRYHWAGEECPHTTFSYPNFGDLFNDSETVADLDLLFGGEE